MGIICQLPQDGTDDDTVFARKSDGDLSENS